MAVKRNYRRQSVRTYFVIEQKRYEKLNFRLLSQKIMKVIFCFKNTPTKKPTVALAWMDSLQNAISFAKWILAFHKTLRFSMATGIKMNYFIVTIRFFASGI